MNPLDATDLRTLTAADRPAAEELPGMMDRAVRRDADPPRCAVCGWIIQAPWNHPVYGKPCKCGQAVTA